MQSLGRRYVQYINKHYRRSGTLWEGRHKASVVDVDKYLMSCYRYIELNPVMANMVEHPGDYRWSSYRCNAYGESNKLVADHSLYLGLGMNSQARQKSYRELFNTVLTKQVLHEIRTASDFSMPLGDNRFKLQVENALKRSIVFSKRGRPESLG